MLAFTGEVAPFPMPARCDFQLHRSRSHKLLEVEEEQVRMEYEAPSSLVTERFLVVFKDCAQFHGVETVRSL